MSSNQHEADKSFDESSSSGEESWVDEIETPRKETRKQPWKKTFGDSVNNRFDDGQDLVKVTSVPGGSTDYDFQVQANTLAA
jgi:hypothetical protein